MEKRRVKNIIDSYLKTDFPEDAKPVFKRWLTGPDSYEEKERVLQEMWDGIPITEGKMYETPADVLSDAVERERHASYFSLKKKIRRVGFVAALAACLALCFVYQWAGRERDVTCLASSETAKGEFILPDGSKICLNRGSRLYYSNQLKGARRKVRLEGEGYFSVSKDARRPFIVQAGELSVTALGTRFTVSAYDPRSVNAYLEEGKIRAAAPGCADVILQPDEALSWSAADTRIKVFKEEASDHTLWAGGQMEFVNRPMAYILKSLNHWYGVQIRCDNWQKAAQIRLSMIIRQDNLEDILSLMKDLADFSYSIDDEKNVKITFE